METRNAFQVQAPLRVDGVAGEDQRGAPLLELDHQAVMAPGVARRGDKVDPCARSPRLPRRDEASVELRRTDRLDHLSGASVRSACPASARRRAISWEKLKIGVAEDLKRLRSFGGLEFQTMRDNLCVRQVLDAAAMVEMEV